MHVWSLVNFTFNFAISSFFHMAKLSVGQKPTRTKAHWTKAHWDKSPLGQKTHLYAFNRDRFELMDKPQRRYSHFSFICYLRPSIYYSPPPPKKKNQIKKKSRISSTPNKYLKFQQPKKYPPFCTLIFIKDPKMHRNDL